MTILLAAGQSTVGIATESLTTCAARLGSSTDACCLLPVACCLLPVVFYCRSKQALSSKGVG